MKAGENKELYLRYLLGDQPESEREHLEQEYFANPEVLEALHSAEDDLIDAYVRGMLSARQQKQFEDYYLGSASRRQRVEFARTLWVALKDQGQPVLEKSVQDPAVWSFLASKPALATALALAVILLTALGLQNWRLRLEVSKMQSAQADLQRQILQLRQESAALRSELVTKKDWPFRAEGVTISMLLLPGSARGGDFKGHPLSIPAHAASVILALDLEQQVGGSYRAVLETAEGAEIRKFENLKSSQLENGDQAIFLNLPANSLNRGDFVIRVFNHTDPKRVVELHPYSLTVIR